MASKWCGFGAFRCYLLLMNTFYIAISVFLIGLVVVARSFAYQISSVYVVIGVAVVASILFILAIIGIVASIKQHQIMLFFYMILLGISGVTLFAVSAATLAFHEDFQEPAFRSSWESLTVREKTDVQNSLNCCGFDNITRHTLHNGTEACNVGHPFCNTTTLLNVDKCCHSYNSSAVYPLAVNNTCPTENTCPDCLSCYSSWESTVTVGVKTAGAFGLVFSFTQILGILITFRYRNLKDPYANPSEYL